MKFENAIIMSIDDATLGMFWHDNCVSYPICFFRKNAPAHQVSRAFVYATHPHSKALGVVGYFIPTFSQRLPAKYLWQYYSTQSLWSKSEFDSYFKSGSKLWGCAVIISHFVKFEKPMAVHGTPPRQFSYCLEYEYNSYKEAKNGCISASIR